MSDGGPSRLEIVRGIEERAFNAWPARETRLARGWLMRFSSGYTKRANSVNAWCPEVPLGDILDHAIETYASRDLPFIARLSPLADADADALLEALGFSRIDETIVMTTPLDALPIGPDAAVVVASKPTDEWLEGFAIANGVPAERRAVHDAMVANIAAPVAFAKLEIEGTPAAWGIAAVERGLVGLFDIVTSPAVRRQGAGRRLVAALLHWAHTRGARSAYLQVVAANYPAIALYQGLGFAEAYRYHYRIAPR